MFDFELLNKIDHAMMMVDVDLMEWQGHLDMAALACLELTVYETEPTQMELPFPLTVKRVPLTKGRGGPVIGVADVDLKTGLMRAEIDDQYKELIGFPDAFSLREDDPPQLDHQAIKAQLKSLIDPQLYRNQYEFQTEHADLKMMIGGKWRDITGHIAPIVPGQDIWPHIENHDFFKES